MQDADQQLLRDAIARNVGAVLSLPTLDASAEPPLHHHKSRFLADGGDGFWLESIRGHRQHIEALINSRQPCGVSFKSEQTKIVFTAPLIAIQSDYRLSPTLVTEALLLEFPQSIKIVHRRESYRVDIPPGFDISFKIWRIPSYARLPEQPKTPPLDAQVHDLSIGGLGATISSKNDDPPNVGPNDRLRVELTSRDQTVLIEGRVVYPTEKPTSRTTRLGARFKPAGNDIPSRQAHQTLNRIVGELQRAEVRQLHRLAKSA